MKIIGSRVATTNVGTRAVKPKRLSVSAERRAADREQERRAAEMRAYWFAKDLIGEPLPDWGRADPPKVATPSAWETAPDLATSEVSIGALGCDYVAAVLLDRRFDLWDAIYVVSGRRYPSGTRLDNATVAALSSRIFCCSECKHWRATHKAGAFTVTSLYPSVRCMDCRRVAGNNAKGGYFRDVGGIRKLHKGYATPERNSLGQSITDVMDELVDDPEWGYDESVEEMRQEVREIAKEVGLIVKVGPELTKAMKERLKEVREVERRG